MIWPVTKLEDLCHFIKNGKSIQQTKEVSGLPITRIETIANQTIDVSRVGYAGVSVDSAKGYLLEVGDILFSHINSVEHLGKVALYTGHPEKLVHGMNLLNLRPDQSKVDFNYLLRALRSRETKAKLLRIANKSVNQASIAAGNLKKIEIPLPPLPEQRRIAAILDKADTLRAKRREAIAKLDQLQQSVFLEMFGNPVANSLGWPITSLSEVCDVRDGTHDSPKYVESGYPLVTSKNLASGQVNVEGAQLISNEDYEAINKRSKVDFGDLLMPMIGTIGNPVIVDHAPNYAIKNIALIKFGQAALLSNKYLLQLLRSDYFKWATAQKNRGGTQKFLALKDIRGMQIPLPPIAQQLKFSAWFDQNEVQRAKLKASELAAEALFLSLQRSAFNGGFTSDI